MQKSFGTMPGEDAIQFTRVRRTLWFLVLMGVLWACSEPAPVVYEVRGVFIGTAFQGEGVILNHEAIPGFMDAMQMTFRLKSPEEVEGLTRDDKVRFRVVVTGGEAYVEQFEQLPEDTELLLASRPTP